MPRPRNTSDKALIDACHVRSIELLRRNLTPAGILAASPGDRAHRRGYTAIFGRDAAICAIGMALSGDPLLERAAAAGLETLGEHQAPNGQIPKFVEPGALEADFW
ncbi:MAG: glycoside hydrolase, partial [Steroidobacteraceae bacterium]